MVKSSISRTDKQRLNAEELEAPALLEVLSKLKPVENEFPDIDSGLGTLDDINLQPDG